ncbi:MAG: hypothetical protein NTY25_04605, partial [Planctomycetia bacterium]|nr:hypothetical protein [Planctomycetia bacterium]
GWPEKYRAAEAKWASGMGTLQWHGECGYLRGPVQTKPAAYFTPLLERRVFCPNVGSRDCR